MKPRLLLPLALANAALATALVLPLAMRAARRPHYGGTLRVELGDSVAFLDPTSHAANEEAAIAHSDLSSLVFETLVRLDPKGRPQPALAESWEHDSTLRLWTFRVRRGVVFHDGTPLTPGSAATALANADPAWRIGISADGVRIETSSATPDLPLLLAESRYYLVIHATDGSLAGTGPFRIAAWEAGKHVVFIANEDYWGGRPFLDSVDLQMARPERARLIDLQLGKADMIDLPSGPTRHAADDKIRLAATSPIELLALILPPGRAATDDPRIREALSRSIDRAAIVTFLLQKQGEQAGSLSPQWISGAAFLFPAAVDPVAARALLRQISPAPSLVLGYDSSDALEQSVAERIVVDGREIGMTITARAMPSSPDGLPGEKGEKIDARLARTRILSPSPRAALAGLLARFAPVLGLEISTLPDPATPGQLYLQEKNALDTFRVIPLVHMPRVYGLGIRVRNWDLRPAAWREGLPLADVWLDEEAP